MKILIFLLFILNKVTYSISVDESKKTLEYLTAQSIWGLIFEGSLTILILSIAYYILLFFTVKKNELEIYSIIYIDIFKNKIENKDELKKEILIKIGRSIILIMIWCFSLIISYIRHIFPFFSILIFIISMKPIFYAMFPNIEKSFIEKYLLVFFSIISILSLGITGIMSEIVRFIL